MLQGKVRGPAMHEMEVMPATVGAKELQHIPGRAGAFLVGDTLNLISNPMALLNEVHGEYGPVCRTRTFMQWVVRLRGADALEYVVMNRDKNFSSRGGWVNTLGVMFPDGLLLRDGDQHRHHRRIMQSGFQAGGHAGLSRPYGGRGWHPLGRMGKRRVARVFMVPSSS